MQEINKLLGKIINADCMDVMKDIPDKYFELAIVDPPYGIGESKDKSSRWENRIDPRNGREIIINKKLYKNSEWDNSIPNKEYFHNLFRISKNQIIWGGNYFIKYLYNSPCFIVWDKVNGVNDFADCELAWTSFRTAVRQLRFMWCGFLQGKDIKNGTISQGNKKLCEKRIHPTQKPVALYRWLLQNYAKPGDKIIDTHSGSASCAIACHLEKHDFLAIEKDYDYWKASVERYETEISQGKLF